MENRKPISDLLHRWVRYAIIVQPQTAVKRETFFSNARERLPSGEQGVLETIFDDVFNLRLLHSGSLHCGDYSEERVGTPVHFEPCGGALSITTKPPNSSFQWLERSGWEELFLSCSNSKCQMKLGSNLTLSEMQDTMLHLMLKQVFPDASFGNYIACDQREPDDLLKGEELENIQGLGVVALAYRRPLFGIINNGYFGEDTKKFSLGFILMPGMRTLYGFDGFDGWARFLFSKKMEQLNDIMQLSRSQILGPKPE